MKIHIMILVFFVSLIIPITAGALPLEMDPSILEVEMNCGVGSFPCVGGSQMDLSLLAGDSDTNTLLLLFSNLTGPVDDLLGIGFYNIAPGVGNQIVISDIDLIASSFDTFSGISGPSGTDFLIGLDNFLLRMYDNDGIGLAVLSIQLEETPRSIFVSNTGTFQSPPVAVASVSPVPEPSTILLLGSGLIGLVGFMRMLRK